MKVRNAKKEQEIKKKKKRQENILASRTVTLDLNYTLSPMKNFNKY